MIAAIVPVYNPEPGLIALCEALTEQFGLVIVVNDGSDERLEDFNKLPENTIILRHTRNYGKGTAIKTALKWVMENRPQVEAVVFADGDGQHQIKDIVSVANNTLAKNVTTFGVRDFSRRGVPFRSWWGNRWTSLELWLLHGFKLSDTQTGLRAYPRRLIATLLKIPGLRFEYEAAIFGVLKRLNEPIATVPISTIYRNHNRASHFRPFTDTFLTQGALFRKIMV